MSSSPVQDAALFMSRNVLLKPLAGRFGMAQNGQSLFKVKPIRGRLRVDLILILGGATKVRQSPLAGVFFGGKVLCESFKNYSGKICTT